MMNYESFLELVKNRRSIRNFRPDPVADSDIDKIIEAARWAPSGFNLQPWEFIVVTDQKLKDKIVGFIREGVSIMPQMEATRESWQGPKPQMNPSPPPLGFIKAPVFIILFGDMRTRAGLPMIHRYSEESWEKTFISSLASAFLYMHLAATSLGLASQWVSIVSQPTPHFLIKQLLGIPDPLKIYDMMALGYPDMEPRPRVLRSMEEIVHKDFCGEDDFMTDEEVKEFIYKIRNPKSVS
jgi:nitroreductase